MVVCVALERRAMSGAEVDMVQPTPTRRLRFPLGAIRGPAFGNCLLTLLRSPLGFTTVTPSIHPSEWIRRRKRKKRKKEKQSQERQNTIALTNTTLFPSLQDTPFEEKKEVHDDIDICVLEMFIKTLGCYRHRHTHAGKGICSAFLSRTGTHRNKHHIHWVKRKYKRFCKNVLIYLQIFSFAQGNSLKDSASLTQNNLW